MKVFIDVVLWIWQAPQNILGLIMILITGATKRVWTIQVRGEWTTFIYWKSKNFTASLGDYIIFGDDYYSWSNGQEVFLHEAGHQVQSAILGPLYLLAIGLPSLLWRLYFNAFHPPVPGAWFYTEKWANRIMGVHIWEE